MDGGMIVVEDVAEFGWVKDQEKDEVEEDEKLKAMET